MVGLKKGESNPVSALAPAVQHLGLLEKPDRY
jgi:hypothetical protein